MQMAYEIKDRAGEATGSFKLALAPDSALDVAAVAAQVEAGLVARGIRAMAGEINGREKTFKVICFTADLDRAIEAVEGLGIF
jgi:hypothetical protein